MLTKRTFLLKTFLILVSIEIIFTTFVLATIPADSKNAVLFGLSSTRLLLIACLIALFIFTTVLLGYILTSDLRMKKIEEVIDKFNSSGKPFLFFISIFIFGILFLLTPPERIGEAIVERLVPVILLAIVIALQFFMFQVLWEKKKINFTFLSQWKTAYFSAGLILGVMLFAWMLIVWSKIGIVPEKTGWAPPGTPILPQQVFMALGIGFFFYLIKKLQRVDIIVGIILWIFGSLLWLTEPLRDWSYFTTEPTPPNFESYPYSDAQLYDTFAQNYLIGESLSYGVTHRPGYAIFLAFLHAIAGQDYEQIIQIQIFILALGPSIFYLLVAKLGGRPAGIVAALMMIFREKNAIALTNIIEVSHSKLLMSDVPTMVLTIIFVYFLIHWLQSSESKLYLGIITGACLGLGALIRSQALIVIPIIFVCILIAKRESLKLALKQNLILLFGVLVVIAPWVWRNYQISGRMLIEYQNAYTKVIASGYTNNPVDIERLPNESIEQYDDRMFSLILDYIREHPIEVSRFYLSYFVHNEISSIVHLPMSLTFWDPRDYVRELTLWGWNPLFANPTPRILPFFFITLGLIAFGIGLAYQRAKWIGLLPLLIHLGYSFSVVPFKTSGWRFILPVDWVLTLYFSIGLMYVTLILFSLFNSSKQNNEEIEDTKTLNSPKIVPVLIMFLLIGLAFPLVEKLIPEKYPDSSQSELINSYILSDIVSDDDITISSSDIDKFLETEPTSIVVRGSALYPSYYQSGEFWGDDDSYPLEIRNINRLQFFLIGSMQRRVYIPINVSPEYFPHGVEVFVVGCQTNAGIRALLVQVNQNSFVNTIPWNGLTCSQ